MCDVAVVQSKELIKVGVSVQVTIQALDGGKALIMWAEDGSFVCGLLKNKQH